jgi:hypothetical protein
MHGEALESALATLRLYAHAPVRGVNVDVLHDGLAVVADGVERAAHRIDEHTLRAGLVDEVHHPRRLPLNVGNRRELDKPDTNDAVGCGNRRRERIGGRLGQRARRHHQCCCYSTDHPHAGKYT